MNKISVFIIAKNEADRIGRAINSAKFADEIIVVDSGSSDNTVEIAKSLGAKTFFKEWEGFGKQKIFAESKCNNKWVLNLDADEELTEDLIQEIQGLELQDNVIYRMKRLLMMPRQVKRPVSFAPSDFFIRLYNTDNATYRDSPVHDSVVFKKSGVIKTLKNPMLHYSFRSYQHMVEKINFYTSMQADDLIEKNKNIYKIRLLFEPFLAFFKAFILRRYFVYGIKGVGESIIYAFSRSLRLIKYFERKN